MPVQIVSTFLKSLDIPWPSIFGTIMARVSVVNLNLVQLPKTACLNPSPSFYKQFNGYTLGLAGAMLAFVGLYFFGTHCVSRVTLRNMPAAERADRLAKFRSTVLSRALLVRACCVLFAGACARGTFLTCAPATQILYIVYPGVSVAIFSIFSCTTLNSGRAFLDADLAITCYDRLHWRYIAAGVAWLFVVPFGVPAFFIWLLRHFHVPKMAALMIDNAWLCEAAEHAWTQGLAQPDVVMKSLNVDTISDNHLEALYALLVRDAPVDQAADIFSGVAPPLVDDDDKDVEQPKGLKDRAIAAATAASKRIKGVGASCARPCGTTETGAVPDARAARRQLVLEELLVWCRTSGVISLPVMRWDEVDDEGDDGKDDAVNTGYVAPSPSGRIACRDLPRLQARALKEVGFLFAGYTCECWCVACCFARSLSSRSVSHFLHARYWESVELLRKLMLTSILALIAPGSAGQVVVGFVLAFIMLMAKCGSHLAFPQPALCHVMLTCVGPLLRSRSLRIRPFEDDNLNSINAMAQLNMCAFLFVALLLKVDVDGQSNSAFFSYVVGALSVLPIALPVLIKVWLKLYGGVEARNAVADASWE